MRRRRAREIALQALYAQEMSGNPGEVIVEDLILTRREDDAVKTFAAELFTKSLEHKDEFDDMISKKALNWDFHRIAIIDKLIMRLALCEFLYFEDIPPKVSIDEAIEIAKKYSTEKSGQFINGMLDALLIDLKKRGLIRKSGRGLHGG